MKNPHQLLSTNSCVRQLSKLQQKYQTQISKLSHHQSNELHNPFHDLRTTLQTQNHQIIYLKQKIKAISSQEQKRKPMMRSQNVMTESHEAMRMQEWMSSVEQKVSDYGIFVVEILAQSSPEDETMLIGLRQLEYLLEYRKKYLLQVQLNENEEEEKEFEISMQGIQQGREELRANLFLQKMIDQLQNLSPTDFFMQLSSKLGLEQKWNAFYKPLQHSFEILDELKQYVKPQKEPSKQPLSKKNRHFEENQKSLITIERVISILEVPPNLSKAFYDFKCSQTVNQVNGLCLQEIYKEKEAAFKQEQGKRKQEILGVFEDVFREFLRNISGLFRTDTRPIYFNSAALQNKFPYKFHDNLKNSFINQSWKNLKEQLFSEIGQIFKSIHRKCQFYARCSISLV